MKRPLSAISISEMENSSGDGRETKDGSDNTTLMPPPPPPLVKKPRKPRKKKLQQQPGAASGATSTVVVDSEATTTPAAAAAAAAPPPLPQQPITTPDVAASQREEETERLKQLVTDVQSSICEAVETVPLQFERSMSDIENSAVTLRAIMQCGIQNPELLVTINSFQNILSIARQNIDYYRLKRPMFLTSGRPHVGSTTATTTAVGTNDMIAQEVLTSSSSPPSSQQHNASSTGSISSGGVRTVQNDGDRVLRAIRETNERSEGEYMDELFLQMYAILLNNADSVAKLKSTTSTSLKNSVETVRYVDVQDFMREAIEELGERPCRGLDLITKSCRCKCFDDKGFVCREWIPPSRRLLPSMPTTRASGSSSSSSSSVTPMQQKRNYCRYCLNYIVNLLVERMRLNGIELPIVLQDVIYTVDTPGEYSSAFCISNTRYVGICGPFPKFSPSMYIKIEREVDVSLTAASGLSQSMFLSDHHTADAAAAAAAAGPTQQLLAQLGRKKTKRVQALVEVAQVFHSALESLSQAIQRYRVSG